VNRAGADRRAPISARRMLWSANDREQWKPRMLWVTVLWSTYLWKSTAGGSQCIHLLLQPRQGDAKKLDLVSDNSLPVLNVYRWAQR